MSLHPSSKSEHSERKTRTYRGKKGNKDFKPSELDFKILILSMRYKGQKYSVSQMAKILKKGKSTVSEHISRLQDEGFLIKKHEDGALDIMLTNKGKEACSVFLMRDKKQDVKNLRIRLHKFEFSFPIVRKGSDLSKELESGNWLRSNHHTWIGYRKRFEEGDEIFFSPKTVRVYLKPIYDYNIEVAHSRAISLVLGIKKTLENEYPGLVLGKYDRIGNVLNSHYALEMDPFACLCTELGYSFNDGRLGVDCSAGVPELEGESPVFSLDDMPSIRAHYDWLIRGGKEKIHDGDIDSFKVQALIIKKLTNLEDKFNAICKKYGFILPRRNSK